MARRHPLLEFRPRLAAHRRDTIKTLGLKRVSKTLTWQELLAQDEQPADQPASKPGNGHTEAPQ
jgi:hypothetical protein